MSIFEEKKLLHILFKMQKHNNCFLWEVVTKTENVPFKYTTKGTGILVKYHVSDLINLHGKYTFSEWMMVIEMLFGDLSPAPS